MTHQIVDAEGFHAATPARITKQAGVTRAVLYQQFGDLAGVFVALIDRESAKAGTSVLAAQIARAEAGQHDDGGTSSLVRTLTGMLEAIDAQPAAWRLFLIPPEGAPPELYERLAQSTEAVGRYIESELRRRYPDLADPELTARMVQVAGRELMRLHLTDPAAVTTARIATLLDDLTARRRAAAPTGGAGER